MLAMHSAWKPAHLQMLTALVTPWLRALTKSDPLQAALAEDVIETLHVAATNLGAPSMPPIPVSARAAEILAAFAQTGAGPARLEQQDRIETIEEKIAAVRRVLGPADGCGPPERYRAAVLLQDVIAQAVAARQALTAPLPASRL